MTASVPTLDEVSAAERVRLVAHQRRIARARATAAATPDLVGATVEFSRRQAAMESASTAAAELRRARIAAEYERFSPTNFEGSLC